MRLPLSAAKNQKPNGPSAPEEGIERFAKKAQEAAWLQVHWERVG